nr:S8 family serine peptidase [uncultured Bacteroides sp.]
MKRITLLYCFFTILFLASAQAQVASGKLSPHTKTFLLRMNQKDISTTQRKAILTKSAVIETGVQEYINAFIYLKENAGTESLEQQGVKINSHTGDIVTAMIPISSIENVASLPEVKYVQIGTPVNKKMDKARVTSGVDKVQAGTSPLTNPLFGKGVVIGIIDTGFEYGHPNFYNKDHTEYRVKRVWEQNAKSGPPPTGFSYGKELSNQNEILAAKRDTIDNSHGTHVTGIAAGADHSNNNIYYGIAGEADIVLVSYIGFDTDVLDGMKYIYDYATSVGKPCVINLSIGGYSGPHDGTSSFDLASDQMQKEGRLLVGAVGNEGNKYVHLSKTFNQTDTICKTFLSPNNIVADIWGEAGKDFMVQVCVYDTINNNFVYISPEYKASDNVYDDPRLRPRTDGATGYLYIMSDINPINNKPHFDISTTFSSVVAGNCIGIIIKSTEGTVHAWSDAKYHFTSNDKPGWTDGDNNFSMDEVGGTGKNIISVGAYVSKNMFTNLSNEIYGISQYLNTLATFSSIGPTVDGRMKPDITAPGSVLASSISSYDTKQDTYKVKETTVDNKTYYYGIMGGTSMSTPYVTGVLATWLQANPNLTPDKVKAIFQKTAINDSYTGDILPNGNSTWGYGKIDAYNGLLEVIKQYTSIEDMPILPQSIFMYSGNNQQFNFLFTQEDTNVKINVFNVNGQQVLAKNFNEISCKQEETINLNNLPKGLYIIKITGNKLNQVFKASTK